VWYMLKSSGTTELQGPPQNQVVSVDFVRLLFGPHCMSA
jgi:hypothetical protein